MASSSNEADEVRRAISTDVDANKILAGLDLLTATDEEIDGRFDDALIIAQQERRRFFPSANGEDLSKMTTT